MIQGPQCAETSAPPPTPHTIQVILYPGVKVGGIPDGGLRGAGVDAHQPPDSLCAPPSMGHNNDSGGR